MKRLMSVRKMAVLLALGLVPALSALADEGAKREGAQGREGERRKDEAAPRGQRQPAQAGARSERSEFPEEVGLTEEQQKRLNEVQANFNGKMAELAKKRDAFLTEEQRTASAEAQQKIRAGGISRQEAADLLAAALKLTDAQKTQVEAIEKEAQQLRNEVGEQKMAVLTSEQKAILRKLMALRGASRELSIPGDIVLTDDQKASLKVLEAELAPKLAALTEQHGSILTDERKAAREAAYRAARETGKDRQGTADAVDAALSLTEAEKAQLASLEQELRELRQQIQDRKSTLLTAEQRAELEKKYGTGRGRN